MSIPPELQAWHDLLLTLKAVHEVSTEAPLTGELDAEQFHLSHMAELPLGILRRQTQLTQPEVLLQTTLRLIPDSDGWRTLDFLAWFTRDSSRGKTPIQLRLSALPPVMGEHVQLGRTTRVYLEFFIPEPQQDYSNTKRMLMDSTGHLKKVIDLYDALLIERNQPSLRKDL